MNRVIIMLLIFMGGLVLYLHRLDERFEENLTSAQKKHRFEMSEKIRSAPSGSLLVMDDGRIYTIRQQPLDSSGKVITQLALPEVVVHGGESYALHAAWLIEPSSSDYQSVAESFAKQ